MKITLHVHLNGVDYEISVIGLNGDVYELVVFGLDDEDVYTETFTGDPDERADYVASHLAELI